LPHFQYFSAGSQVAYNTAFIASVTSLFCILCDKPFPIKTIK
jgi:hypothetical protein